MRLHVHFGIYKMRKALVANAGHLARPLSPSLRSRGCRCRGAEIRDVAETREKFMPLRPELDFGDLKVGRARCVSASEDDL